jgi:hypothetical protein
MSLTTNAKERKSTPIFSGVVAYFPDALAAVARVSKAGNDQHNPGQPLHWAREKSTDQMDAAMRHMVDYAAGVMYDTDGEHHLAKVAWRILAQLQIDTEEYDERDNSAITEGSADGSEPTELFLLDEYERLQGVRPSVHESGEAGRGLGEWVPGDCDPDSVGGLR